MNDKELLDFLLEGNEYDEKMLKETEIQDEILENPVDLEYSKRNMRDVKVNPEQIFDVEKIESGVPIDFIEDNDDGLPELDK
jgi:hypothetical protein